MKNLIILSLFSFLSISCTHNIYQDYNNQEVYMEFWTYVDENYIFFEEKEVDWDEVRSKHALHLDENSTDSELKEAMEKSILELRDNHNALKTDTGFTEFYDVKEGYEIHFSLVNIKEKYIEGSLTETESFDYGYLREDILYVHLPKTVNIYALQNLLRELITDDIIALVIDVRDNGGGNSNLVPELLGDFVEEKTFLGTYVEKSGPGHEDEVHIAMHAEPSEDVYFDLNTYMLTNRKSYSATSYFTAMCKGLDNFKIVGQITGGGAGGTSTLELSNGWLLSVSVSDFKDKEGLSIEQGVMPDVVINNSVEDIENGKDLMLEAVLSMID